MAGECVHVVGLSLVPLCQSNLHVSRSTAGQTLGHEYFVAKLRMRFREGEGQVFAHRTHLLSGVLGNIAILSGLPAGLVNRVIFKGAENRVP